MIAEVVTYLLPRACAHRWKGLGYQGKAHSQPTRYGWKCIGKHSESIFTAMPFDLTSGKHTTCSLPQMLSSQRTREWKMQVIRKMGYTINTSEVVSSWSWILKYSCSWREVELLLSPVKAIKKIIYPVTFGTKWPSTCVKIFSDAVFTLRRDSKG